MKKDSRRSIRSIRNSVLRKGRRGPASLILLVGFIVALSAYFLLSLSGFSAEYRLVCGLEEHTCEASCYGEPELVCGLKAKSGHMHGGDCFVDEIALICEKEEDDEYTHGDACVGVIYELVCVNEESDEHSHCDGCYDTVKRLICFSDESTGHSHSGDCIHIPLICGFVEHVHSADCYTSDTDKAPLGFVAIGGDDESEDGTGEASEADADDGTPEDSQVEIQDTQTPTQPTFNDNDTPYYGGTDIENIQVSTFGAPTDEENGALLDSDELDETDGDAEDAEGLDEDDEDDEDEEAEENEDGEVEAAENEEEGETASRSLITTFDTRNVAQVDAYAAVTLPIHKYIDGMNALDAISEMGDNDAFRFEAIRLDDINGTNGQMVAYAEIRKADFGTGLEASTTITITVDEYGKTYYRLSETIDTAGIDWLYDLNHYLIEIDFDGDRVTVTVTNTAGGGNVSFVVNELYTSSIHPLADCDYNQPVHGDIYEVTYRQNYIIPHTAPGGPYRPLPAVTVWLELESGGGEVFTLCADSVLQEPVVGLKGHLAAFPVEYYARYPDAARLSVALFDSTVGAKLTLDEFNELFGFGLPGQLARIEDPNARRVLVQHATYQYRTGMNYADQLRYTDYYDHYIVMLEVINELVSYYQSLGPQAPSLSLVYDKDAVIANSGTITVVYTGGNRPGYDIRLTWTGDATVTIGGQTYTNGALGILVKPGDTVDVEIISGDVMFVAEAFDLVKGSIKGDVFELVEEDPERKLLQSLISGCVEFYKLAASVTIGAGEVAFTNLTSSVALPTTIGVGADKFIIAGAILILTSIVALFASGVKPAQQGILNENKTRFLSISGKRKSKTVFYSKRRE